MSKIISINNAVARMPERRMKVPVNFELNEGEHIAIVGNNGSGKTTFIDMILQNYPLLSGGCIKYNFKCNNNYISENIRYLKYTDCYGCEADKYYYIQQRWNQADIPSETYTVGDKLNQAYFISGSDCRERRNFRNRIEHLFGLNKIYNKYIISISSGELRKLNIAENLFFSPRIMIIDNPYIGLDEETRNLLNVLLTNLAKSENIQFIIVLSKVIEIPSFIHSVVEINNMTVGRKLSLNKYKEKLYTQKKNSLCEIKDNSVLSLINKEHTNSFKVIAELKNVNIRYGKQHIIQNINWTIKNGDRWLLTGPNGSGKSTLLSIICADNPQSYASDIILFDKKRGTGDNIWEIKKRIGYISPEIHRTIHKNKTVSDIIMSGMNLSIDINNHFKEERCHYWLNIFKILHLSNKLFNKISSGEQRMTLLARAFVNNPDLLVLDEPYLGLDQKNIDLVNRIIDEFCSKRKTTLIFVSHCRDELPTCIDHEMTLEKK